MKLVENLAGTSPVCDRLPASSSCSAAPHPPNLTDEQFAAAVKKSFLYAYNFDVQSRKQHS